ncbi:MAG: TonB-dependent receptor [Acidobacteria bacterium]|nr:TonB-dependent receptor [Acidobacteriota bacterium]
MALSVAASLMVAVGTGLVSAQTSKGAIAGNVADAKGDVVPGATVTATNTQTGAVRETVSDIEGNYRFDALDLGSYRVTIRAAGFKRVELAAIPVRAAQITTADVKLDAGLPTETVEVTETAGVELQKEDGGRQGNISPREITELPLAGLNPIALALTLPGVTAPSGREDFTNGVGFSVNGTRPRGNNFLLDGQDNNDNSIAGQAFQPINRDAIQEVAVLQGNNSAEFGRAGASVTNVITRGGTNSYHGTVSYLIESQILNALDTTEKLAGITEPAVFTQQTFGFSLGGPIAKNKLLFFVSPQWQRFRSTANGDNLNIPTAGGVATLRNLFPAGQNRNVDLLINSLGDLRGVTNPINRSIGGGRPPVQFGIVTRIGVAQRADNTQWAGRVDWLPSSKDTISFRYYFDDGILTPDNFANFIGLPGIDTFQGGRSQNFGINYVRTFSSNVVNEFRFSFGRINFVFAPISESALVDPAITVSGVIGLGLNATWPQSRLANNFQYQDTVRILRGSHNFSLGVDLTRQLTRISNLLNDRGSITFNPGGGFTSLGNFVDDFSGLNSQIARDFGERIVYPNTFFQNYFVSDTWKVRPNLSIVYGLRYEYYGTPENVLAYPATTGNPFEDFPSVVKQRSDTNNLAPRFSFAYTPKFWNGLFGDEKTVIRGGYGVGYEAFFYNILVNTGSGTPNVNGVTVAVNSTQFPGVGARGIRNPRQFLPSTPPTTFSPTATQTTVAEYLKNPLIHSWNFGVQREFGASVVVDVAYVGSRGTKLFTNDAANGGIDNVRINPARGDITVRTNAADSYYHSLQTMVERRFVKSPIGGLFIRGSYTFSKFLDTASEVFVTSGDTSFSQNYFDRRSEKGPSVFDRRNRFVLSYLWEIPGPPTSSHFALNTLGFFFRDWQFSGIGTWQSGAPFTVTNAGVDANGDLRVFNDRPNLSNPNAPFNTWAVDAGVVGGTPGLFYDGPAFYSDGNLIPVDPSGVRFIVHSAGLGTIGRNNFTGGAFQRYDVSLIRRFRIPKAEGHNLEFRWEAFNVFNHSNTGVPPFNLSDPQFGDYELSRTGSRTMRFQLKYVF